MSTPKGYPSQTKLDRVKAEFATVESVREEQQALSVLSHMYVRVVGTDAAEASSTTYVINATAHAALKGDIIRFTSGVHSGKEIKVQSVTTNAITLAYNLAAAVGTGDTFEILRHKYPVVNADGSLNITSSGAGPIQYVLNGVDTEVELDTVTPANSRPLPVEIIGTGAPINITAGDLNVSLSHANDSVKIGDGTETANVNASNELQVADDTARTSLSSIDGKTPSLGQALMAASVPVAIASDQSAISVADGGGSLTVDGTVAATQSGTWNINNVSGTVSLPTGAATLAEQQTQTTHLATVAGAVSGTEMQVDVVSSALPTGASTLAEQQTQTTALQLIDDAVATTGAAITAKGLAAVGTDGTNARILKTDAAGELQVDVLSTPADIDIRDLTSVSDSVSAVQSGTWNINNVSGTVSLPTGASTLAEQQSQTTHLATIAGAVSGTEMQVDVLTQPARSHTIDSIRLGDGTDLASVTAAGQLEVSVTAALPSGTNNIGDVDVLTEPATAADGGGLPAVTKVVAGYDGSNVQVIKTDANGELQVDVLSQPALSSGTDSVAAVQSGTWNITDISGTVSLPTGASTLAEQQTQTTALQLIDDTVATTGAAITAKGIAAVGTDGTNARILKTDTAGELQVDVLTVPTYDVVDFIDTTPLLDTSSTNIAGSASNPTQVVASLAADVKKVQFLDTTGAFIGLYTGAALSEVLQAVFGPGSDQTVEVKLSSGERVSLRRLDSTTAISTGFVSINFIG